MGRRLKQWVSMPHAALWVVQLSPSRSVTARRASFNAARGFVGGAALLLSGEADSISGFQCRTRLCGWCSSPPRCGRAARPLFQCRTRLCGWCSRCNVLLQTRKSGVSMPHAALWVVQREKEEIYVYHYSSFNAARGFVGGAAVDVHSASRPKLVSMPHAALWVVQLRRSQLLSP